MTRIIGRTVADGGRGVVKEWRDCAARMEQPAAARSQAATLLMNARAQARTIVTEAHEQALRDAETVLREAWDAGYAEGLERGREEVESMARRLGALLVNAVELHQETVSGLDNDVFELVMAMARAVVRHELSIAPDTVLDVARAALDEMSADTTVHLRVHPDGAQLLLAQLSALGLPAAVQVTVVPDAALTAGGCLVETRGGRVDATIETQLARLETLLRSNLHAA